jgi:hypothetical protein
VGHTCCKTLMGQIFQMRLWTYSYTKMLHLVRWRLVRQPIWEWGTVVTFPKLSAVPMSCWLKLRQFNSFRRENILTSTVHFSNMSMKGKTSLLLIETESMTNQDLRRCRSSMMQWKWQAVLFRNGAESVPFALWSYFGFVKATFSPLLRFYNAKFFNDLESFVT